MRSLLEAVFIGVWIIIQVHVEELHQVQQLLHLRQQQLPHHQLDVDLPNGLVTNGVMMKTTMLIVTGMVALVVIMILVVGTLTAPYVNVLIPIMVVQQRKPLLQPLPKPLLQPLPKPQQPLKLQHPQPKVPLLLLESVPICLPI